MAYPEDHGDFILDTDACDSSIGAVLSEIQDGRLRVIAYGSRTFNKVKHLDIASPLPCLDPGLYSTVKSNAERISTHLAILPLGSLRLKSHACDSSIGAVLSQIQDGRLRVIAYGSRTLNKAEKNYCITDKELSL
jgi:hypothetical protein